MGERAAKKQESDRSYEKTNARLMLKRVVSVGGRRGNNTCLIGENRVRATLSCSINRWMEKRRPLLSVSLASPLSAVMTVATMTMTKATDAAAAAAAAEILFCSAGVLIAISQACASKDRRGCWEGKTLPPPAAISPMIGLDKQAGRRRATVFNP